MQVCKTCLFFKDLADTGPIDWGECRQHAPVPVTRAHDPEARWPRVKATDGCGKGLDRRAANPAHVHATDAYLLQATAEIKTQLATLSATNATTLTASEGLTARLQQVERWQAQPWYKKLLRS